MIEIVAADFVAGLRTASDAVAGDVGKGLRQEASLDVTRAGEILLHALHVQRVFVVAGVFDGDCGLSCEMLEEVLLVEGERRSFSRDDDHLGEDFAAVVQQRKPGTAAFRIGGRRMQKEPWAECLRRRKERS